MRKTDQLLGRLDEVEVPDIWTDVGARRPGPMLPPQKRTQRPLVIVVALIASIASLALLMSMFDRQAPGEVAASTTPTHPAAPVIDGWYVSLSYQPTSVGPLAVSFGPVRKAPGKAWAVHRYTLTNNGNRTVTLDDTRTSKFLGPKKTILVESGCGYWANGPNKPVHAGACTTVPGLPIELKRGHSVTYRITLMTGLPGMGPVTSGTYVFNQPIAFSVNGQQTVGATTASVQVTYQVADAYGISGGVTPSAAQDQTYTAPAGWTAQIPDGWQALPFDTTSGPASSAGVQISNVTLPAPTVRPGYPIQVNSKDLPDNGIALIIATDEDPSVHPSVPLSETPLNMGMFTYGSAPAGAPTLDTLWFSGSGKPYLATVRTGPNVNEVDQVSLGAVVSSVRLGMDGPRPGTRGSVEPSALAIVTPLLAALALAIVIALGIYVARRHKET